MKNKRIDHLRLFYFSITYKDLSLPEARNLCLLVPLILGAPYGINVDWNDSEYWVDKLSGNTQAYELKNGINFSYIYGGTADGYPFVYGCVLTFKIRRNAFQFASEWSNP